MTDIDPFQARRCFIASTKELFARTRTCIEGYKKRQGQIFWSKETRNTFTGTCLVCGKKVHKKQECWNNPDRKQNGEQEFTVSEQEAEGWLHDSGASSHMCPFKGEFVRIRSLKRSVEISVANGETVPAAGVGTIPV